MCAPKRLARAARAAQCCAALALRCMPLRCALRASFGEGLTEHPAALAHRAPAQNAGDTPLVLAVRFGKLELALLLLQHGAKAAKGNKARAGALPPSQSLRRPLGRPRRRMKRPAAQMARPVPAAPLLTLQTALFAGSQEGVTALHEAAKRSYAGAVQVLVRGIPPRQLKEALNAKDAVRAASALLALHSRR